MPGFKRETVYLIIRADRYMRLGKRPPRLGVDEVAIRLNVAFPDDWGRILTEQDVTVALPDFTPTVTLDGIEERHETDNSPEDSARPDLHPDRTTGGS